MVDFFSDYTNNNTGKPQLDKDYWKNQNNTAKPAESINVFDNMINTNFDLETLKSLSVFKAKK